MSFFIKVEKMITMVDDEWLVDTEALICSNGLTKIVVGFTISGETYVGKIKDMPIELTVRLSKMKNGEDFLKKAVLDAEEVFNKEIFEKNEKRNSKK
jgi:hypothetical protein